MLTAVQTSTASATYLTPREDVAPAFSHAVASRFMGSGNMRHDYAHDNQRELYVERARSQILRRLDHPCDL